METRRLCATTELNEYLDFPHVAQVFRLQRLVYVPKTDKHHHELVYGLTSLSPELASPERLLALQRGHWAIENRSHYVRDVTFDEDRSKVRTANGPRVMASLRNFAISVLRLLGATNIASACRELAAPHLALRALRI